MNPWSFYYCAIHQKIPHYKVFYELQIVTFIKTLFFESMRETEKFKSGWLVF